MMTFIKICSKTAQHGWREATKPRAMIFGIFAFSLFPASSLAQATAEKQREAIFVRGFSATSPINQPEFQSTITAAFFNHRVSFLLDLDREESLQAILRADILYFSVHAGPTFKDMQTLQVKPSDQNLNKSPKGNSLITSQDIAVALKGREGPRLVIINGCALTNPTDGVAQEKRISSAFGITEEATGRAFIGWDFSVVGNKKDTDFRHFLVAWTQKDVDGKYPTLGEVLAKSTWGITKPPTLIGDRELRYSGILGIEFDTTK